jgi:hypothetical protein
LIRAEKQGIRIFHISNQGIPKLFSTLKIVTPDQFWLFNNQNAGGGRSILNGGVGVVKLKLERSKDSRGKRYPDYDK